MLTKKYSTLILLFIGLGSLYMAYQIPHITFDYNIESFFPINSDETAFYNQIKHEFGTDNDFILIAIQPEAGIFNEFFLRSLDSLTRDLQELPHIEQAYSITNAKQQKFFPVFNNVKSFPYLHLNSPNKYLQDSLAIIESPQLSGFLISEDRSSVLIYLKNTPLLEVEGCKMLKDQIQACLEKFAIGRSYLSGKCIGQSTFSQTIQTEIGVFILVSILVIAIVLLLMFRSFSGLILPLVVVGLAVLWTMGTIILLDRPISLVSNIIPSLLLIIGISDVIHLLTQFIGLEKRGFPRNIALQLAIRKVGAATILTSITTILGFLSLLSTRFVLLQELGIYASFGVFIALVMTYAIIPPVIRFFPTLRFKYVMSTKLLDQMLSNMFHWVVKHKRSIVKYSFIIGLFAAGISTFLQVNLYLLTDLRDDHPLRKDFSYISDHFGGSRPQEIIVEVSDTSLDIFSFEVLQELQQVENYLTDSYGFKKVYSPLQMIKTANQVLHGGSNSHYQIPDSNEWLDLMSTPFEQRFLEESGNKLVSEDRKRGKISGLLPDLGSKIMGEKNEAFDQFIANHLKNPLCRYKITGTGHLLELNTEFLAKDILWGLIFALLGISVVMGVLLKSVNAVFIALIPNILPLLCLAAIMALFGISIKISTAIIFLIALGISVDDSIHFLSHFQQERKDNSLYQSVKNSYLQSGKAIVLTSIILSAGFGVLCLSDFLGTFYIGALVSLSMVLALIADLVLLPALLLCYMKK